MFKLAIAMLVVLSVGAADAAVSRSPSNHIRPALTLSCITFQVGGNAPSLQMTNNGPGVIPGGTKIHWVVKQSNGDYTFPYPVQVHQIVVLNGVARSGIGDCSITVIP